MLSAKHIALAGQKRQDRSGPPSRAWHFKLRHYRIPFQRGTTLFFWNKAAFKEVGLDPEQGPKTWDEVVDYAQKLTKRNGAGQVTRWGMQVPSSLTPYWILQGYVQQNEGKFFDPEGTQVWFNAPETVEALQYWSICQQSTT